MHTTILHVLQAARDSLEVVSVITLPAMLTKQWTQSLVSAEGKLYELPEVSYRALTAM